MPAEPGVKVAVLGAGAFGTAIARVLACAGSAPVLWGRDVARVEEMRDARQNVRHLPGIELPPAIEVSSDLEYALSGSAVVFVAVPTQHVREVVERSAAGFVPGQVVVSLAKGIERGTRLRPTEVLRALVPEVEVAALTGPSHAEEVARDQPTTVVVAADQLEVAQRIQELLSTPQFRVYTNPDLVGIELGGATKNVIAIAAGILDGLELGDNTKSALLTRGLAEITRLGIALGANPETFFGLAGVGDLVTTCYSRHGRNRALGEALGRGETLEEYRARTVSVAEGAFSVEAILELASSRGVDMPISTEVQAVMHEGKRAREAIHDLMTRTPKPEGWDVS